MFKVFNLLRKNKAFTLAEVSISTAALAGLLAIFALLPSYKIRLTNVENRQKAYSIINEITSQLENASQTQALTVKISKANADGSDFIQAIPRPAEGQVIFVFDVKNRRNNTTYKVSLQSFYLSMSDENGDGEVGDIIDSADGSNLGRVKISITWPGGDKPVEDYQTLYNSALFQ